MALKVKANERMIKASNRIRNGCFITQELSTYSIYDKFFAMWLLQQII